MSEQAAQEAAELADDYAVRAIDLCETYVVGSQPSRDTQAQVFALLALASEIRASREARA